MGITGTLKTYALKELMSKKRWEKRNSKGKQMEHAKFEKDEGSLNANSYSPWMLVEWKGRRMKKSTKKDGNEALRVVRVP